MALLGITGVALLQKVQENVYQAQEAIRQYNNDSVKTIFWPAIKKALNEGNDPPWLIRNNLRVMIHERLDEQGLHVVAITPIIVKDLVEQAEKVRPLPSPIVVKWLPF